MKPGFKNKLQVEELDDARWKVLTSFLYESKLLLRTVVVPDGFVTDFASVPRIPFIFDVLGDIAHGPAVVHDWLYMKGTYSRLMADRVLLEAMKSEGLVFWKRYQIYLGVRLGGWVAWREHRSRDKS